MQSTSKNEMFDRLRAEISQFDNSSIKELREIVKELAQADHDFDRLAKELTRNVRKLRPYLSRVSVRAHEQVHNAEDDDDGGITWKDVIVIIIIIIFF